MAKYPKRKRFDKNDDVMVFYDARNAFYMAGDPRRRIDERNGRLVGKDLSAPANLPQDAYQTYFPGQDLTGMEE